MALLVIGLVLFLGVHSTRIFAEQWRSAQIAQRGERAWKGLYSVASLVGLVLVVWGYGLARQQPHTLWTPANWARPVASALMLVSFVLLAAAYVPGNAMKSRLGHPMLLGVKTWALAHLIANGSVADLVLFGSFLVWAVLCFRAARQRDRVHPPALRAVSTKGTLSAIAAGVFAWLLFAWWAHAWLIGVSALA
jgi:uncharacterized membrane protein